MTLLRAALSVALPLVLWFCYLMLKVSPSRTRFPCRPRIWMESLLACGKTLLIEVHYDQIGAGLSAVWETPFFGSFSFSDFGWGILIFASLPEERHIASISL